MWLILTFVHALLMAGVNYVDEYLSIHSSTSKDKNIHKRIGGGILISALWGTFSIITLGFFIDNFSMAPYGIIFSILSAIPMILLWLSYFYLLQLYSAHQVIPLFGLSSIWLLLIELLTGSSINFLPLVGVIVLVYGAYILDTGTFFLKIPTRLLLYMSGASFLWAVSLFIIKMLSQDNKVVNIFFYQYIGIFIIGCLMYVFITPYRQGFLDRIKNQGRFFLGLSFFNESASQLSFFASTMAVALAPLAVYVSSISSVQYIFLFIFFYLFPIGKRNEILNIQVIAITMMIFGVFLIEFFK